MVDIGEKKPSRREATATSIIEVPEALTAMLIANNGNSKKGSVFHTAIVAGTMAVKNTSAIIPFCHPLPIDDIGLEIAIESPGRIQILCRVKCFGRTGVEMEALNGASAAALTIYDMLKSATFDMTIRTKLLRKSGGRNGRAPDRE